VSFASGEIKAPVAFLFLGVAEEMQRAERGMSLWEWWRLRLGSNGIQKCGDGRRWVAYHRARNGE
jgi:hypothetical protein